MLPAFEVMAACIRSSPTHPRPARYVEHKPWLN